MFPAPAAEAVLFNKPGTLGVTTGVSPFPLPRAATLTGAVAAVNTAPTGQALIVDVKRNGTTVYTTTANRPTVAAGTKVSQLPAPAPDVAALAAGDVLTVDVSQVGSVVAGADLVVTVTWF